VSAQPTGASPSSLQSLTRGLAVIRCFDAQAPSLTLSEVAERASLPRATARRILLTLVDLGYVRADGRAFRLGPGVLELGYHYLASLGLPDLALPALDALAQSLGESTSASVLDGEEIVYIARVPTRRILNLSISVGTRYPAARTAMGRVLLAALDEETLSARADVAADPSLLDDLRVVREQGWAVADQLLEAGLLSIAVPLHRADGAVVAAINTSTTTATTDVRTLIERHLPALQTTAHDLEAALRSLSPQQLPAVGEHSGP